MNQSAKELTKYFKKKKKEFPDQLITDSLLRDNSIQNFYEKISKQDKDIIIIHERKKDHRFSNSTGVLISVLAQWKMKADFNIPRLVFLSFVLVQ